MKVQNITIPGDQIADFCRQHGIRRLALFGSVLGDEFGPDSDVDMLVEFVPGRSIGMLGMAQLENALTKLVGRKVDLRTPGELSRYFRDDVLRSCQNQYVEE